MQNNSKEKPKNGRPWYFSTAFIVTLIVVGVLTLRYPVGVLIALTGVVLLVRRRKELPQSKKIEEKMNDSPISPSIENTRQEVSSLNSELRKLERPTDKQLPFASNHDGETNKESLFSISIKTTTRKIDSDPVGVLSVLDFGKPAGELGSLLNYTPYKLEEPTDKQLAYAADLGLVIPPGSTKSDVSCLISRATGEDSKDSPGPELVALADGFGLKYSACIGADGLFRHIVSAANDRDRAALFIYAVRQSLRGEPFGDMLADPEVGHFYAFADQALNDPGVIRSITGRDVSDFKKPNKGTNAYKVAAAFIAGGGVA